MDIKKTKSRSKGISFTYMRGDRLMHCGIKNSAEYERLNNCQNPLAPTASDVVSNVYVLGIRRIDLDGYTSEDLKACIPDPFVVQVTN